jgi:hypothetical protein
VSSALIHVAGLDIERGYEDAFAAWYESEHVPRMLSQPGWSGVRRYECLDGEPRHVAIYDLDEDALDGIASEAPYRDPTFARRIRNYHARTLARIHAQGDDPAEAELINLVTVDMRPEHAAAFSRWYSEVHVPEMLDCPGWLGNERFESLDGDPRFMAIYGLSDADRPFNTEEYESVVGWDEHVEHIRGYHGWRIYRLLSRMGSG